MGFLSDYETGKGIQPTATSSGGFLAQYEAKKPTVTKTVTKTPVKTTTAPIKTVTKTVTPAKVVAKPQTFIQKATESLSGVWNALKAGTKQLPEQTRQSVSILGASIAKQQQLTDKFFKTTPGRLVQSTFPLQSQMVRGASIPILEEIPMVAKAKQKALQTLGDISIKEVESAGKIRLGKQQEYEKTKKPTGKWQGLAEAVAYNLPQLALTTALTVGTGVVTKRPDLAAAVGLSGSYGMGASEVYQEARNNGVSEKKALPLAMLGGTIIGALDFVPLERLLRKTGAAKVVEKSIIKNITQGIISASEQGLFEGTTEGVQQVVSNAIAKTYNEKKSLLEGVQESVLVGLILGGGSDITINTALGMRGNGEEIEKKIEQAVSKPKEKRTEEEQAIVDELLTNTLDPDEALATVIENNLDKTDVGKEIVKASVQAKETNQDIRIVQNEERNDIEVSLVSKTPERVEIKPQEEVKKTDQLEALKNEARKYKSAEEFVKAQGTPVYHGGTKIRDSLDITKAGSKESNRAAKEGFWFAKDINTAKGYGSVVMESYPNMKNPKVIDAGGKMFGDMRDIIDEIVPQAKKDGFDGVIIKNLSDEKNWGQYNPTDHYVVFSPDKIKTKSQLTDIYNQAKGETPPLSPTEEKADRGVVEKPQEVPIVEPKTVEVPRSQLPVGEGREKVSRLEERVTESLQNIPDEVKERLGIKYQEMNKKEQIQKASEYVINNPEEALKVLSGDKEAPKGILTNAIYVAMQNLAKGDVALARKLTSISSTRMGQEISILTEIDPNSPVKLMQEIVKFREEAFKKRYGDKSPTETKKKIVKEIQSKVKKPDKYDWNAFINSIEC